MAANTGVFRQTATGKFSVGVMPGTPHCGPNQQRCFMDYRVDLYWNRNPLNRDGFLLDNTWFRSFFGDLEFCRFAISCELLASMLARQILEIAEGRAHRVCVTLEAVAGVTVSCEYDHADLPHLPPLTPAAHCDAPGCF
jgi:hypothetical protein